MGASPQDPGTRAQPHPSPDPNPREFWLPKPHPWMFIHCPCPLQAAGAAQHLPSAPRPSAAGGRCRCSPETSRMAGALSQRPFKGLTSFVRKRPANMGLFRLCEMHLICFSLEETPSKTLLSPTRRPSPQQHLPRLLPFKDAPGQCLTEVLDPTQITVSGRAPHRDRHPLTTQRLALAGRLRKASPKTQRNALSFHKQFDFPRTCVCSLGFKARVCCANIE